MKVREVSPATSIEVLTPDFQKKNGAIEEVVLARPDVFNHNLETVPRLYATVRPGARYFLSLQLLNEAKRLDPQIFTKSGLMVGLGETDEEIEEAMGRIREAGVDMITLGQYLQPSYRHLPVDRFPEPGNFADWDRLARELGFGAVASGPLVRSSYRAGLLW